MSRRSAAPLPPCYAMVLPGLESIAEDEIVHELGGDIKRSDQGIVVFRLPEIDGRVLRLRTVEDVYLLAWGTDQLSYRAEDLERIRRWTEREANWEQLLRIHHALRPKPKGKPTYHLVTQMTGEHGYRRVDAGKALSRGLAGKLPASWRLVAEDAAVEIWLTIHGATAVCGLRLSDRTMRHRTYKQDHRPASLRPTLAAALVRLAGVRHQQVVVDPMCGAGTLLAELLETARTSGLRDLQVWGGDCDTAALRAAAANLRRLGQVRLARWDAGHLPLPDAAVDCILSNPPFGKQLSTPAEIGPLYRRMIQQYQRVLRPGGKAVLLVSEIDALKEAIQAVGWKMLKQLRVRVLGQLAYATVWKKV